MDVSSSQNTSPANTGDQFLGNMADHESTSCFKSDSESGTRREPHSSNHMQAFQYVDHSRDPILQPFHWKRKPKGEPKLKQCQEPTVITVPKQGPKILKPIVKGKPFPDILYQLLDELAETGFDFIICWCIHGRAFRVNDRAQFETKVMPRYGRKAQASPKKPQR